jgi:NAD(P)H dehydrogenase (quinone)
MILVTGAAGKSGNAVVKALAAKGAQVRTFIRNPSHVDALLALGAAEVSFGSFEDARALTQAAAGVQAIYHICPNVSRDEVAYARAVAAAARTHGVKRFVYHSVLHPQIEAMPHHWQKMRVEEMLFVAGFDLTVLQPFIVEARPRLGGRAWTVTNKSGFALDLGCNCGSVGRCRRATGW